MALWDGELADVEKAATAHAYRGDVIDFELPKAVEACRRGWLEKIDATTLPAGDDGTAPLARISCRAPSAPAGSAAWSIPRC